MLNAARCLLALVIVPSLAFAQKTPPPAVSGHKIDPVRADPMPQGIKDLLVFRGAPAEWRPPPVVSPAMKGLSSADKLALVKSAAGKSGASAEGSSMGPYLALSRATMGTGTFGTPGRGYITFWEARNVTRLSTVIAARLPQRGAVELVVYPEAAGQLYLAEFQVSRHPGLRTPETACSLNGSGRSELTFRLSGSEPTIVPMVFESASSAGRGFMLECVEDWRFISVEVSVLR